MEPVELQQRMAIEKVGRSVPLSRSPSMEQTSRLARDEFVSKLSQLFYG